MPPMDPTLRKWWPTTQSMDLVDARQEVAAGAVLREYQNFSAAAGFVGLEQDTEATTAATLSWHDCPDLDTAFTLVGDFDNCATKALVLPTHSQWSVLWVNNFLCDGFDSLCHCLTKNSGLRTIHWSAHDAATTFQSGSMFCVRALVSPENLRIAERYVQSAQTDRRWDFFTQGEPLPEEKLAEYAVRRKRDRLDEERLLALLGRLNAHPWHSEFYALPGRIGLIERSRASTCLVRTFAEVLVPPLA